jgi:opacity protein-like surface antigen
MKKIKFLALTMCFFFVFSSSYSQLLINAGLGISNYYGDLTNKTRAFDQSSFGYSIGIAYKFLPKLYLRGELSSSKVQADDKTSKDDGHKARNLNFKSDIYALDFAIQYDFRKMETHMFTPYFFYGIGIFHFDTYTTDRFGIKRQLQPLGTEGQGVWLYPDRTPYSRTQIEVPMGFGVKYNFGENITAGIELKYRYLSTDYLDDVSMSGYIAKGLLEQKNSLLPLLTYRGDELKDGAPYPTGGVTGVIRLNRGNPTNKDCYYTTQMKVEYRFKSKTEVEKSRGAMKKRYKIPLVY